MVTLWQIGDLSRWTSLFPYDNSDRLQDPHDNKLDKFKKIDGTVSQQFSSGGKISKKVKSQKKKKQKGVVQITNNMAVYNTVFNISCRCLHNDFSVYL